MKTEEFKKILGREKVKPCNRFTLEEALMQMYRIADDLSLALDKEEQKAAVSMHLMRTDELFEVFEDMILRGKIL